MEAKRIACERCFTRKKSCDKNRPCERCVRDGVPPEHCKDRPPRPLVLPPKVRVACQRCRKLKACCDNGRPCQRCVKSGHQSTCVDHVDGQGRSSRQSNGSSSVTLEDAEGSSLSEVRPVKRRKTVLFDDEAADALAIPIVLSYTGMQTPFDNRLQKRLAPAVCDLISYYHRGLSPFDVLDFILETPQAFFSLITHIGECCGYTQMQTYCHDVFAIARSVALTEDLNQKLSRFYTLAITSDFSDKPFRCFTFPKEDMQITDNLKNCFFALYGFSLDTDTVAVVQLTTQYSAQGHVSSVSYSMNEAAESLFEISLEDCAAKVNSIDQRLKPFQYNLFSEVSMGVVLFKVVGAWYKCQGWNAADLKVESINGRQINANVNLTSEWDSTDPRKHWLTLTFVPIWEDGSGHKSSSDQYEWSDSSL